jgi:hypothetical protein
VCTEASTVLGIIAVDLFFNCWYLEIPSDNHIRHVSRCVHYHLQGLRLGMFQMVLYGFTFYMHFLFFPSVLHGLCVSSSLI